ncbi:hypothetical protein E4H12_11820 [Candidatus Thorarchaeota archaeon]|nr:MAG: hypothetical protein E4H12_11820 [Candidatus Thorarchaeota archaeon]
MKPKTVQQQNKRNSISWSDVYFYAEANKEPFQDVNIVTLKSYFTDKAYDRAITELGMVDNDSLRRRACEIIDGGQVLVSEHVKVSSEGIRVVVDCAEVNDDVLWTALDLLAQALETLEGSCGKVIFGEPTSFKTTEISWLNLH